VWGSYQYTIKKDKQHNRAEKKTKKNKHAKNLKKQKKTKKTLEQSVKIPVCSLLQF